MAPDMEMATALVATGALTDAVGGGMLPLVTEEAFA
jgi:histidine ammonia-lyase